MMPRARDSSSAAGVPSRSVSRVGDAPDSTENRIEEAGTADRSHGRV